MSKPILACTSCGATKPEPDGTPTDLFPSAHCGDCPPWTCTDCGEACSASSLCSCWTRLDTLPLADIKAIIAGDGTFDVKPVTKP
ncbi:hypothetical protein [Streptomyces achromogenes]|uniref:hypothetical protein n=1 Tax=Streptomyces achromogenes TaxID=67255 RepID=UPI003A7FB6C4